MSTIKRRSRRSQFVIYYLLMALLCAVAGFSVYQMGANAQSGPTLQTAAAAPSVQAPKGLLGSRRPAFSLPNRKGTSTSISKWDGKVVLINFWATWCPPCREETPELVDLQKKYGKRGFQVVGVAIDKRDKVEDFTAKLGADYPQLISQRDATQIASRYGNGYGVLPYSVLIDRQGVIRFVKPGKLDTNVLEGKIRKLL